MLTVRLDNTMENQLNSLSEQMHLPKSKIVKDALIHYFDMMKKQSKEKTPYELGSELFGKHSSQEGTLSTTYKQKLKDKINAKNAH